MLGLLTRFTLTTVEGVLLMLISLVEALIVIRVVIGWLIRFGMMRTNRFSDFIFTVTEPILAPIRAFLARFTGNIGIDLSPLAALLLCEILSWLVRLIF